MIKKLIKATGLLGVGFVTEAIETTNLTIENIKPEKLFGCYMNKPEPKAYIILDKRDPLDLEKAIFILKLNGEFALKLKKCLELKVIEDVKFVKWYKCIPDKRYEVKFRTNKNNYFRNKVNDLCSNYLNCTEIHDEINHSFRVASARYYNLLKESKAFPDKDKSII